MSDIKLLPLWREALANFLALEPKPGTLIRRDWLMEQFGIKKPVTAEEYKAAELEFLTQVTEFRRELLEIHCIELHRVSGVGFEVVHPRDQTKLALKTRSRNIGREIQKMVRSIRHVNTAELTESERAENSDGLAKAASLATMFNRRRILGRDPGDKK